MRFLCLHGMSTNAEVLEYQFSGIRSKLAQSHELVFFDGHLETTAAPGVEHMFPGPYYAYYTSSSAEQVQYAYDRVLDFVKTNGPFGGVIGFSQGGALAATALLHHAKLYPAADPLFKLGIFLCATLPFLPPGTDESDNSNKDLDNYDPQNGDRRVMIPTVHIIGRKDQYVGMCESLAELCSVNGNANGDMTIVHHDQGHLVSRDPEFVRKAAAVIDDKLKAIESS